MQFRWARLAFPENRAVLVLEVLDLAEGGQAPAVINLSRHGFVTRRPIASAIGPAIVYRLCSLVHGRIAVATHVRLDAVEMKPGGDEQLAVVKRNPVDRARLQLSRH